MLARSLSRRASTASVCSSLSLATSSRPARYALSCVMICSLCPASRAISAARAASPRASSTRAATTASGSCAATAPPAPAPAADATTAASASAAACSASRSAAAARSAASLSRAALSSSLSPCTSVLSCRTDDSAATRAPPSACSCAAIPVCATAAAVACPRSSPSGRSASASISCTRACTHCTTLVCSSACVTIARYCSAEMRSEANSCLLATSRSRSLGISTCTAKSASRREVTSSRVRACAASAVARYVCRSACACAAASFALLRSDAFSAWSEATTRPETGRSSPPPSSLSPSLPPSPAAAATSRSSRPTSEKLSLSADSSMGERRSARSRSRAACSAMFEFY
mmetsp:Transcript_8865/g.28184  ORF Transcript_8865/g.28184 Transcript_8865/m.28184 type:complete len:347 (+) Transcript_8865:1073-2113(+)